MKTEKKLTIKEAREIVRLFGYTLRKTAAGDFRANVKDGREETAIYSDDLEDCVKSAASDAVRSLVVEQRYKPHQSFFRKRDEKYVEIISMPWFENYHIRIMVRETPGDPTSMYEELDPQNTLDYGYGHYKTPDQPELKGPFPRTRTVSLIFGPNAGSVRVIATKELAESVKKLMEDKLTDFDRSLGRKVVVRHNVIVEEN